MFVVDPTPTFQHVVKVAVPVNGGFKDQTCKATFRVLPHAEGGGLNLGDAQEGTEFLKLIVQRIDDIADVDGNPIEWNDEVRDQLFAHYPYLRRALARTYFEALEGVRVKN